MHFASQNNSLMLSKMYFNMLSGANYKINYTFIRCK